MHWAQTIALAFVSVHSITVLGMYVIHLVGSWRDPHQPTAPLRRYVQSFVSEWLFSLGAVLSYALGLLPTRRPPTHDPAAGPPILLVHGYMMNRACFLVLAWRLRRRGYRNVRAINLSPMFTSIDALANKLGTTARELAAHCNDTAVHIIAHSQGGLVSRCALAANPNLPIRQIVTIGSPHRGTRVAGLGIGANAAQMCYDCKYIQDMDTLPNVPLVSIYSAVDALVLPARSAAFGHEQHAFHHVGHFGMLVDAQVFATVLARLPAPAASDAALAKAS